MFRAPEHALAVAYGITSMPIEPKNATQLVIEMLRERFDIDYRPRELTGLSPHDWHAQAAMILLCVEEELRDKPILLAVARTEFGHGMDLARGAQTLTGYFGVAQNSTETLACDYVMVRLCKGRPKLASIASSFGISQGKLRGWQRNCRDEIARLRRLMVDTLDGPMQARGIVTVADRMVA